MGRELVQMGARVSLAEDQTSSARELLKIQTPHGVEIVESEGEPLVLDVVHFVDLEDGRFVAVGDMSIQTRANLSEDQLRDELYELIYEDELREIDELADEPRWEDMLTALKAVGVTASDADLAGLPFTAVIDDAVRAKLKDEGPGT